MITPERLRELLDYEPSTGIFTWKMSRGGWGAGRRAGQLQWDGYVRIGVDGAQYPAHHLAWLFVHGELPVRIDHENRNRSDNRIDNLRPASQSQNIANSGLRSTNTSGLKGVSRDRASGRWRASIKVMGVSKNLGMFDSPKEAHRAYAAAAATAWGEFSCAS